MSIFSDYECGAIDDDEYRNACIKMNAEDRYERDHMFDDPETDEYFGEENENE